VGDVTGDGLPDVLSTTPSSTFEVRAQLAGGGFARAVSYPALPGTSATAPVVGLTLGDTDGDGRAEVHVSASTQAGDARIVTWAQAGGDLRPVAQRSTLPHPGAIVLADVVGDGHPDLVVAHGAGSNIFTSSVGVYDSTPGAGGETPYAVPGKSNFGSYPGQIAAGDLTGDGSVDVATISPLYGLAVLRGASAGESLPSQDFTPPETTITGGPSGTTYSRTATFDFTAEEPATFVCSLDGTYLQACTTGKTYSSLALGTHTFEVAAVDADGNRDATPARSTFTVADPPPPPPPADLAVSLSASPTTVKKGASLTWTTTVRNVGRGPASATSVALSVPDLASVTVTTDRGASCPVSGTTATCTVPALAAGAGLTVTARGTVLGNKGTLSSFSQVTPTSGDTNAANDSAWLSLKVGNGQGN
jgi:hypothetical protein